MKKILGVLLFASSALTASNAIADSVKTSSSRDGVQCIDGGEKECGIAWEGRSLFQIDARAKTILSVAPGLAALDGWDENLDLQMAYLCCTGDETRRNICDKTHKWVVAAHCTDYVGKFFHSDSMLATYDKINNLVSAGPLEVWPTWSKRIRDLTNDIASSNRSGSARTMQECMEGTVEYGASILDIAMGNYVAEKCVAAIFDTLRDESTCLWNNANGEFCDE